jgi:predicted nucleotidyltransferase component of viral defense system
MRLLDKLVSEALKNKPELNFSRTTVEKEILHHDILKILSENGFLTQLTFIGGTALRCCYNGQRLSEDLDFTGGKDFTKAQLSEMGKLLEKALFEKYDVPITVSEPRKDDCEVSTWKIVVKTKPKTNSEPSQHINIDICAFTSFDKKLKMLQNHYGINLGTSGLILQVQSAEEIFADKLIAFALRRNRLKYRDLWDIYWLHQQGYKPNLLLLPEKLHERQVSLRVFIHKFEERLKYVSTTELCQKDFYDEMKRFVQIKTDSLVWPYLVELIQTFNQTLIDFLNGFIGERKTNLQLSDWQLTIENISINTERKVATLRFKNTKEQFIQIVFCFDVFSLFQCEQYPEDLKKQHILRCLLLDEDLKQPLNIFINTIYANPTYWIPMLENESPNIVIERLKLLMLRSSPDKLYQALHKMDNGERVALRSSGDPEYPRTLEIMYL